MSVEEGQVRCEEPRPLPLWNKVLLLRAKDPLERAKIETEGIFGVKLAGVKKIGRVLGREVCDLDNIPFPNIPWDLLRIQLLRHCLSCYPEHFCQQYEGERVHFFLQGGESEVWYRQGYEDLHPRVIGLGASEFDSSSPKSSFVHLTNNLVELTMPRSVSYGTVVPRPPLWPVRFPWFHRVEYIVEGSFPEATAQQAIMAEQRLKRIQFKYEGGNISQASEEEKDKAEFYKQFLWSGTWFNNPRFFLMFLGEQYVQGQQRFRERFEELFGAEKTGNVYDFCKDEIFRGKEYPVCPIMFS